MAIIHGGLIVYSNDGVNRLYSGGYYGSGTVTVTETGLTNNDGSNYIYSGDKKFIGVSTTKNATTPEFKIGDIITITTMDAILYIVEEQPKEYTLRIDGVEVTDYENIIVNGVSYKCKQGATVPTDLTGYTVTVPAGWTATAGYGGFYINYSYNSSSYEALGIGYGNYDGLFGEFSNKMDDYVGFGAGDYFNSISNNEGFTLTINNGTHVTKSELIQWFVDMGATFEKTES